ncbi:TadE/TadG family type IV pilus assembly protein [Naasia sp. SYSU D00948]|uniref:TadE/TadG family type IV pilus assembly protein n=1 Tax=Naasia sp. SYSU D00948 TaxID=2817379 RepID=UPI0027DBBAC1|nr:TadE/TadG family type IV pilus assembly protein [Naasia sp. SYSU D00948]
MPDRHTGRASDDGSAPAEFVMVGAVLVLLVLSVLQLGLALHVRNTVTDAAAEGAGMRRSAEDRSRAGPSGHGS